MQIFKHFRIYIYILLCSTIIAQEPFVTNEWKEISCDGIDKINCSNIWSYQENSNCWIFYGNDYYMYKFTPNKQNATLKKVYDGNGGSAMELRPFIHGDYFYYTRMDTHSTPYELVISKENYINYDETYLYELSSDDFCLFFIMNNVLYLLTDQKLYSIELVDTGAIFGKIDIKKNYPISHPLQRDTSIVTLDNTVYYFSNQGFCSAKISGDEATNELISSVSVTEASSKLVTDNKDRIWIIIKKTAL